MKNRVLPLATAFTLLLGACSSTDSDANKKLEGERIPVLAIQHSIAPTDTIYASDDIIIPKPWKNAYWPQAGGYPNHSMQHIALSEEPFTPKWKTSIGKGSTRALPLTAQPIVTREHIFTLDSHANLTAFDIKTGDEIWQIFAGDEVEGEDDHVITGGIAFFSGALYVTAGYDEVVAVNPTDGHIYWRADIGTPSRAAPTIINRRLYISTVDNRLLCLDAITGKTLWEHESVSETAGFIGSASPAVSKNIAIAAFSSGEISAVRTENGATLWTDNLSAQRNFGGVSSISDINASPIIDRGIVIAMNASGRLVAIDERTGERLWQQEIGGTNAPWIAGNSLFVISQDNSLIAIERETGEIQWIKALPAFEDMEDMEAPLQWTGPMLAGGRLIMLNSAGEMLEANPQTGATLRTTEIGDSFYLPPIAAGNTLYMLDEDGTLYAYE